MQKTDLSKFDNSEYSPGADTFKRFVWYLFSVVFFQSGSLLPYALKASMLRWFGARVGRGVVIKPRVTIKYPWKLSIGDHVWIGEQVWIDNLDNVSIGDHACLSQGALLLTGNHDYTSRSFDLIVKPIQIDEGAWVGAKSVVTQGVSVKEGAVLAVGSVASSDLEKYGIYRGNPAEKVKERMIKG